MGLHQISPRTRAVRRVRSVLPIVFFMLAGGTAVAGCSADHATTATAGAETWTFTPDSSGAATMSATEAPAASELEGLALAVLNDAWAHRPDYTHASAATEAAYAYALHNPHVVQWFPCYCGCGGTGHRSNLDCYFKPTDDGSIVFEEHASYCDICVDITLKASELIARGMSLHDARAAIDAEFAGSVPGTPTELPPL
jgi:hypothetical protein